MKKRKFVSAVLVAPSAHQLQQAADHLRYWPFVKAYQHVDDTKLVAVIYLGDKPLQRSLRKMKKHAEHVMYLCLRQYGVKVLGPWDDRELDSLVFLEEDLFMRPNCTLKSLSEFMDPLLHKNRWRHG